MSSCISGTSTNLSTRRSSGIGDSWEDLSLDNNYDTNNKVYLI